MSHAPTSSASVPLFPAPGPGSSSRTQHGHREARTGSPPPAPASRLTGTAPPSPRGRGAFLTTGSRSLLVQARVSLPGGVSMHSIPGRQVCINTGLPPFFHMHPPANVHVPAPSSPQPPPSPHSSNTHKVGTFKTSCLCPCPVLSRVFVSHLPLLTPQVPRWSALIVAMETRFN